MNRLIVTAANETFVPGVLLLHETLRRSGNKEPLRCYDLGIRSRQSLVDAGIEVVEIDILRENPDGSEREGWPQLSKPRCVVHALEDHERVLWLDSDVAVNRSLGMVWHTLSRRPFFVDQGPYGMTEYNDAERLAKSGIILAPWRVKSIPCSGIVGLGRVNGRDDMRFAKQWQTLCDDYADGWAYWDQGPFIHLVASYKKPVTWSGKKWNVMCCELGYTREETIRMLPPNSIRHFVGKDKPWLNWTSEAAVARSVPMQIERAKAVITREHKDVLSRKDMKGRKRPGDDAASKAKPKPDPLPSHGVGTNFKAWAKLKPCQRCDETMAKMNELGPDGCEAKFDELVDEVKSNAAAYNKVTRAFTSVIAKIPKANRAAEQAATCAVSYALRKAIDEARESEAKRLWPKVATRWIAPDDVALITATDNRFMKGAYLALFSALRHSKIKTICYELEPLERHHRDQMEAWGVEFRQPNLSIADHNVHAWQTWNKPQYLLDTMPGYRRLFWLDSDTLVQRDLSPAFHDERLWIPGHGGFSPQRNVNTSEFVAFLRSIRPIVHRSWGGQMPCAGMFAVSRDDSPLLLAWKELCVATIHVGKAGESRFYDQGVLQELVSVDLQDEWWNNLKSYRKGSPEQIVDQGLNTPSKILHYGGDYKPWFDWENLDWGMPF